MPHSNPATLCQHQLSTGKLCRQITLKDEYFCRHHRRLFHKSENEMIHEEAMERLSAKLQSLDLPDLLHALYGKLTRLRTTVRAHPEAQLALNITLHRLREWLGACSEGEPSTIQHMDTLNPA